MAGDVAGRRVRELLREVARDQEVLYRGRSGGGTRLMHRTGRSMLWASFPGRDITSRPPPHPQDSIHSALRMMAMHERGGTGDYKYRAMYSYSYKNVCLWTAIKYTRGCDLHVQNPFSHDPSLPPLRPCCLSAALRCLHWCRRRRQHRGLPFVRVGRWQIKSGVEVERRFRLGGRTTSMIMIIISFRRLALSRRRRRLD